jgi:hypothetical protein
MMNVNSGSDPPQKNESYLPSFSRLDYRYACATTSMIQREEKQTIIYSKGAGFLSSDGMMEWRCCIQNK